jgi:hypothetical protein
VTGYRQLATTPVAKWVLVAVCARLPVAVTPLGLVFLVRDRPGGYALGAGLAAAYVLGEVAGASVLGPRLKPERARVQLAAGMAVGACSLVPCRRDYSLMKETRSRASAPRYRVRDAGDAAQPATQAVTGHSGSDDRSSPQWIPHVTLSYSTAIQPAQPVIAALGKGCRVAG